MDKSNNPTRVPLPIMRSWEQTPTNELMNVAKPISNPNLLNLREILFYSNLAKWEKDPSLKNAIELMNCANFNSSQEIPKQALSQILNSKNIPFALQKAAKLVSESTLGNVVFDNRDYLSEIRHQIHINRLRLADENRNAMLYAELGRLYATLGESDLAKKYFHMAVYISPHDRFILRNYTRFMLHIEDPEVMKVLKDSELLKSDPWVQATEISISAYLESGSEIANNALKSLSKNQIGIYDQSELAIALSVLEFNSGNRKKSKKLVERSTYHPSNNAIAQIMWNKKRRHEIYEETMETREFKDNMQKSSEALVWDAIVSRRWDVAVQNIINWQDKQLYSSYVAIEGSFIAISFASDFKKAVQICENGLIANSNNLILLNNLCYSHQMQGHISEANTCLEIIKNLEKNWESDVCFLTIDAKQNYLKGQIHKGQTQYLSAIKLAQKTNKPELVQRIKMHLLQEESLSGKISNSEIQKGIKYLENNFQNYGSVYVEDYWKAIKLRINAHIKKNKVSQLVNSGTKLVPNFFN